MPSSEASRPSADLIRAFTDIVGPANALTSEVDTGPFTVEWRDLWHGKTPLVLKPRTASEVSAILKLAHDTGTSIVPQGGNTGLVGGQVPDESGTEVVLSLSRMSQIRDVDAEGYCLTAEAGATLRAVQQAAEEAGRLFPLSLASEGSCQIGGNLSTNAGGIAVLTYGNARDLVLGLEVVLADGSVWNGLRSLRKDNTGYDLKQLFIGAEGTLGVITAAVLKLFPAAKGRVTVFLGLSSPTQALTLFQELRGKAGLGLTAFELMPRLAIDFVLKHFPKHRDPLIGRHAWYVLLELTEIGMGRAEAESLLGAALEQGLAEDAVVAESIAQDRALWSMREDLPETQRFEGGSIKHDISVPIAGIPELIARAEAQLTAFMPGIRLLPFGHFGDGNLHFNLSQPVGLDKAAYLARAGELSAIVYDLVVELGGSISAEHGIGRAKREQLRWVKSPIELELMRRIKQTFDPKGVLNPGRVL
jgi:FAD/FMN-containing dehydrogenase